MYILKIIIFVYMQCIYVSSETKQSENEFKINIIHYNDFHARYEETSAENPICRTNNTSCLGGFPRLYAHIRTLLAAKPDAILLNAGDTFQGTYWHTLLKWGVAQQFMNLLPHDAHAIGNHEFDDGPAGLAPYLKSLKAPILAANLDTSKEPLLIGTFQASTVVERHGRKIGIIGLITTGTPWLSNSGKVRFIDPGNALKRAAKTLTKLGANIVILLSHCGFAPDKELAHDYGEYIDVIIGGHTHTLLWNGPPPSKDHVTDQYPVIINSHGNHKVLVVQAFAFSKYIGDLSVYFDKRGEYIKWEGGPIFLNRSFPEDPEIKKMLEPYAKLVHDAENILVGSTLTELDSAACFLGECALGNLLADAMVEYAKTKFNSSYHYLAFVQIDNENFRKKFNKGIITEVNLFDMYPYMDPVLYFKLQGKHIRTVLEDAVTGQTSLRPFKAPNLQQLSGVRVVYNISMPRGKRVRTIYIGDDSSLQIIDDNKDYHILATKFALRLGKGFRNVRNSASKIQTVASDHTTLKAYIKKHSPLDVKTGFRVVIYK